MTFGDHRLRATATAERMNKAVHEVDPSEVTIDDNRIYGDLTVILHGDKWKTPNPHTDGAMAAQFHIDARLHKGKIAGSHEGRLGTSWSRLGKVSGEYHVNRDI